MEISEIVLVVLTILVALGGSTVIFKASSIKANRALLESNIKQYQIAEKLKDERIAYLEGQVYSKDQTIKKLSEHS